MTDFATLLIVLRGRGDELVRSSRLFRDPAISLSSSHPSINPTPKGADR